ncbi:MAG: hypothetical protein HY762_02885 [Planctomycetes bacterium]|nr:hypothetical protein [Planctomycetota bacterium]
MATVIKTKVRLHIPEIFPIRDDMADKWANGLVNNATLMYQRLRDKIPDAGLFDQKLATPANLRYGPYVPDAYVSRSERDAAGIRNAHYKNLMTGYDHWDEKLALAFETVDGVEAKRFKDQVNNSKDSWSSRMAGKTLRFTGDKIRGRGVSVIAAFWLTDDPLAGSMVREGQDEILVGGPYNTALTGMRTAFRAALVQKITQAGVLIVNSDFNADMILAQNTAMATLLTGLADPAKADTFQATPAPDKSYCSFVKVADGPFYLEIQVVLTV